MSDIATGEWGDLGWSILNRAIDNELKQEYMPSPESPKDDGVTIKTTNDETGVAKKAGTGARIVPAVPNAVVYGVGAIATLGIAYIIFK